MRQYMMNCINYKHTGPLSISLFLTYTYILRFIGSDVSQ